MNSGNLYPNNAKKIFDVIVPVWGEEYTHYFLEIVLPNWLSPYNLPGAAALFSLTCKIYTTPENVSIIKAHPSYRKLESILAVEFNPIVTEEILLNKKYNVLGLCQEKAWLEAAHRRATIILMAADALIADGGCLRCCSLISDGYKAVAIAAFNRSDREMMSAILKEKYYDAESGAITITNRDLIELGIKCRHSQATFALWETEAIANQPSHIYWRAGEHSLLGKFFHMHPFAIDLSAIDKDFDIAAFLQRDTIDGALFSQLNFAPQDIHIASTTDDIAFVDLNSSRVPYVTPAKIRSKSFFLAHFAATFCTPFQKKSFFDVSFRYQTNEIVDWDTIEKKARKDLFVYRLFLGLMSFAKRHFVFVKAIRPLLKRLQLTEGR